MRGCECRLPACRYNPFVTGKLTQAFASKLMTVDYESSDLLRGQYRRPAQ